MSHDICKIYTASSEDRTWNNIWRDIDALNKDVSLNDKLTIAEAYINGARSYLTATTSVNKIRACGVAGGQAKKDELKKKRYNLGSFPSP